MTECIVEWAVELLVGGVESDNLAILAGLAADEGAEEVETYFHATLDDLGIAHPSELESRLREARALATAALSKRIDILAAVSRIHSVAVSPLNHPPMLQTWCDLDGGFITDDEGHVTRLKEVALRDAALAEMERFLTVDFETQFVSLKSQVDSP